jgi:long-subunit fatty acid transport protein
VGREQRFWASVRTGLVVFVALASRSVSAQSSGPVFPPSVVITNYDRVLVGEQESLEAGAFVARVGDSTAGWYNPAGLAKVDRTAIGASASGFETDVLTLQGINKAGGSFAISQLPSYFGVVLGEEVLHSPYWRLGFSITKPVSWSQDVEGGAANGERLSYSSHVSFSTLLPTFSASFAPMPCLRFGAGIGLAMTSLSEVQTLSAQVVTATTANSFLRSLDVSGSIWDLTGNIGIQWDITSNLVVGALVRLPGLKVMSSGGLTYQNVDNNGTPWSQTFFQDRMAAFDYQLPVEVNVGLGWHSRLFELEADLRYHSAISDYPLFSSQVPVQVTTTGAGGVPVVTQQPFPTVTYGTRQVWNWAVGGHVNIGDAWSVHAGFFSDYSPTTSAAQNVFRAVNMYGMTVGTRIKGEHLSASIGFALSWGNSANFTFDDPAGGAPITTNLHITTLSLLYAVTYQF